MALTIYEKNYVEAGKDCLVTGNVLFNVLNKPRVQKPNEYVSDPKPEYVITLENPTFVKGDENLIKALQSTQYGEKKDKISLSDKSPFAPMIFGKDNEKLPADKLIPESKRLANGQQVMVHVTTFKGHGNVGASFDAVKLTVPLNEAEITDAGGTVSADVFDI